MNKPYKQKKVQLPQLSITRLEELRALFAYKEWPVVEEIELSKFERFYKTLALLDDNEQSFLIDLSYRFDHIPIGSYMQYMKEPLKKLRIDQGGNNLLFVTCTPKEDVGAVKSSAAVLYQLKGTTIKQFVDFHPFFVVDNITKLSQCSIHKNTTIILVDDFVGTGETAVAAVDYIHELIPSLTDNKQIILFCIVALSRGIKRLQDIGIKTYCAIERHRGITDELSTDKREAAIAMMQSIEKRINKLDDEFAFGYKGSEALVCLERCPNNTFPIYWLTKNVAPYER